MKFEEIKEKTIKELGRFFSNITESSLSELNEYNYSVWEIMDLEQNLSFNEAKEIEEILNFYEIAYEKKIGVGL